MTLLVLVDLLIGMQTSMASLLCSHLFHNSHIVTARIRRMGEGNIFCPHLHGGLPRPRSVGGGSTPSQVWVGGTPSQVWVGCTLSPICWWGVPHPRSGWGVPHLTSWGSARSQVWVWGVTHLRSGLWGRSPGTYP